MRVICGESFLPSLTLQRYCASLDYRCLGEVRGGTKMDGLQAYHYKWPAQKDCNSHLAISDLTSVCNLNFVTTAVVVDRRILNGFLTGWIGVETVCHFLAAFFYRKVYLGIRDRKLNDVLINRQQESKVTKTTGLLTAAFITLL